MMSQPLSVAQRKTELRLRLNTLRHQQPDKQQLSHSIMAQVTSLPAFQQANTVLFYIDVRDEVRTRFALQRLITRNSARSQHPASETQHPPSDTQQQAGKELYTLPQDQQQRQRVVVPYCEQDELRLVELHAWEELEAGRYGILEPHPSIRQLPARVASPSEIELALIPGLGFDATGARIGHGKGYYDRLLPRLRNSCLRVGIAFDCQLVDEIPTLEHDQRLDLLVTPSRIIHCHRV